MNLISAAVSSKWAKGTGGPAGDEAYNLVAQSLTATGHRRGEDGTGIATPLVAHALRAEGADASEDGTGRGTPIMTSQCWRDLSCVGTVVQNFKDSHMNGGGQVAIAYRDDRGRGNDRAIEDVTYPLHCAKGQSEQQIVAFDTYNQTTSDVSGTLRDPNGTFGDALPAVAFTERGREGGANLETQEELSYALRDPQKGMNSRNSIAGQFGVRRLTPRECERLQGFPDDWTLYDANGKEISDSARYRMLGNAVAVPVATWIGARLRRFA